MTTNHSPSDARDNLDSVFGSVEMEMAAGLIVQHAQMQGSSWDELLIVPHWFEDADAADTNGGCNNQMMWRGFWDLVKHEWVAIRCHMTATRFVVTEEFIERVTEA